MKKGKVLSRIIVSTIVVLIFGCVVFRAMCEWPIIVTRNITMPESSGPEQYDEMAYNELGICKSNYQGGRVSDLTVKNDGRYNDAKIYYEYVGYFLPDLLVGDGYVEADIVIEPRDNSAKAYFFIGEGRAIEHARGIVFDIPQDGNDTEDA